jgi:glycine cleavage system H protein
MNAQQSTGRDLYYTKDHEWVDFKGTIAYTGVCSFKLLGFKEIQKITFTKSFGFKKQGEVIATIQYKDYRVEAHMPVDGKLQQLNETLIAGNNNMLLEYAESSGWIALIIPSQPYERKELLLPRQYRMNGKGKYAK